MPLLFILLIIVALTSLSLPNAMAGVKFCFCPIGKINATVIFTALGLAFFKLSLGRLDDDLWQLFPLGTK